MKTLSQIRDEIYTLMHLNDTDKKRYDKAIIQAVNYAVVELSQEVSPIIDRKIVRIMKNENLLGEGRRSLNLNIGGMKNMNVDNAGSIAFNYMGEGELKVFRGSEIRLYSLDEAFTPEEFSLSFDRSAYTRFVFSTDSRLMVFDMGIYSQTDEAEIYKDYTDIDMDELTGGKFMRFYTPCPVTDLMTDEVPAGMKFRDQNTVSLRNRSGAYEISYYKYPTLLSSNAGGNDIVEVSTEAAEIVPLLCAWRLLKEDDERLATMYYNEYVSAKDNIIMLNAVNAIPDISIGGGVL